MSAKELATIPVWMGNRVLDTKHAATIKTAVGSNVSLLDSNFSIIKYNETTASGEHVMQRYLIDGQHRASVIRDHYRDTVCEADFVVTVREKTVETETDAVDYFNALNNVKPQHWKTDPKLIVNRYMVGLEKQFNTNKKCMLIRPNAKRPYLSSDKLRDELMRHVVGLKGSAEDVSKFVSDAVRENSLLLRNLELLSLSSSKDSLLIDRVIKTKFALAFDTSFGWITKIIRETNGFN